MDHPGNPPLLWLLSSPAGINKNAPTAAINEAIAAAISAKPTEYVTSHPPITEPNGNPDMLRQIETVSTRPRHWGLRAPLPQGEQSDVGGPFKQAYNHKPGS